MKSEELSREDRIELGMLSAELDRAATYAAIDPDAVKAIAKTLGAWAHADSDQRRNIYRAWRNS